MATGRTLKVDERERRSVEERGRDPSSLFPPPSRVFFSVLRDPRAYASTTPPRKLYAPIFTRVSDLADASLFQQDGVTTYSQLLFDVARQQVVVGARYVTSTDRSILSNLSNRCSAGPSNAEASLRETRPLWPFAEQCLLFSSIAPWPSAKFLFSFYPGHRYPSVLRIDRSIDLSIERESRTDRRRRREPHSGCLVAGSKYPRGRRERQGRGSIFAIEPRSNRAWKGEYALVLPSINRTLVINRGPRTRWKTVDGPARVRLPRSSNQRSS